MTGPQFLDAGILSGKGDCVLIRFAIVTYSDCLEDIPGKHAPASSLKLFGE
jgi:hypothetical protein